MAWFGDDASFQAFVDRHGLTFPQLSDDAGEVFAHFDVPAQPALVVVAPDGSTRRFTGAVEPSELDAVLTSVTRTADQ